MPGFTRDVVRTPMHWSAERNAGFTDGEPWLPLSDQYPVFNVETERANPTSILSMYHALLGYRRITPALTLGKLLPLAEQPDDAFIYWREYGNDRRLVALNFSDEARVLNVGAESGRVVLSTHMDREEPVDLAVLSLRPFEGVIVEV